MAAVGLAATLALAGCSGGNVALPSLPSVGSIVGTPPSGSGAATPDRLDGHPFKDATIALQPGRDVMVNPTIADIMQPAGALPEMALVGLTMTSQIGRAHG